MSHSDDLTGRTRRRSIRLLVGLAILAIGGVALALEVNALHASTAPTMYVNPKTKSELYYKPTPMTFTIQADGLSGTGLGDTAGYQYGLQWDPNVLKWLSGPQVGPGTPTPIPVLPCSNAPYVITWGTPTLTPTVLNPTFTPTYTNTPAAGTPSNTPTVTNTPTLTPTPGGYSFVACASISGTAVPSGVLGTWTFQPLATAQAASPLNLLNVMLVDHNSTPVPVTVTSGAAFLGACYDVNGDGRVNLLDLGAIATHFGSSAPPTPTPSPTPGALPPGYDPRYDLNHDGRINLLDLGLAAAAFGLVC